MKYLFKKQLLFILVGLIGTLSLPTTGFAQEFIDGEFMEGGMEFKPDFISAEELKALIDAGDDSIVIVDNAPAMAFEEEHIPGAISFPWARNLPMPLTLPRNKTLVLYCPCGPDDADSIAMAKKLRQFGYFRVKVLHGGWFQWLDMEYPIYESESTEDA